MIIEDRILQERHGVFIEIKPLNQVRHLTELTIPFKQLRENGVLDNNTSGSSLIQRNYEAFFNSFSVDTLNVKYISGPVSHSYTFNVLSNQSMNTDVKNLILAKHDSIDNYIALLMTYKLTQPELLQLQNGNHPLTFTYSPIVEKIEGSDPSSLGISSRGTCTSWHSINLPVPCSHESCQPAHPNGIGTCGHPDMHNVTVMVSQDCPSAIPTEGFRHTSGNTSTAGGGNGINWGGSSGASPYLPNNSDNNGDLLEEGPLTQITLPQVSLVRLEMSNFLDTNDINFLNGYPNLETALNTFLVNNSDTDRYNFVDWSLNYLQYLYRSSHSQVPTLPARHPENALLFDNILNTNQNSEAIIAELQFHQLAEIAVDEGGEVDFVNKVILDSTFINNQKALCIYNKLKNLSNTFFKDVINSQFGGSNNNQIKVSIGSMPAQFSPDVAAFTYTTYVNGSNLSVEQGNVKNIRINPNFINNSSTLEISRTLIHEFIHAELMDRCIRLGLIQEMRPLGVTQFVSSPTLYTIPQIIFNLLLNKYNAYEPQSSPSANPEWNHDLFNALSYRSKLAQNLELVHPLLNDINNDFLSLINNDINNVGGPYNIGQIMDYISWIGLEGTIDYVNNINNLPNELAKKNYLENMAVNSYNSNCTN